MVTARLTFDQLTLGDTFVSAGRTITEADIVNFAGISGDFNTLHTDDEWVKSHTEFQGRIAHGLLILSASNGLRTPGLDELAILAFLNVERAMRKPTYPGDTIHAVNVVEDLRPSSSRPGSGVVTMKVEVRNQRAEVLQTGRDVYMVGGSE